MEEAGVSHFADVTILNGSVMPVSDPWIVHYFLQLRNAVPVEAVLLVQINAYKFLSSTHSAIIIMVSLYYSLAFRHMQPQTYTW